MMSEGCRPIALEERKFVQWRLEAALSKATAVLQSHKAYLLSMAAALLDLRHMTSDEIVSHLPTGEKVKTHSETMPIQAAPPFDATSCLENFSSLGG